MDIVPKNIMMNGGTVKQMLNVYRVMYMFFDKWVLLM